MKKKNEIKAFRPSRWWSNVTALRIDSGVTEKELSALIGKTENYLQNAIRHGGSPNIADALAIAEAFGMTVEELAYGAIGLQIRQKQLEAELARIREEILDAENDVRMLGAE